MIKNILFDMGGVIFTQNTAKARERFRESGIDPDVYLGAFGQKEFMLDLEMGKIGKEEFCRRMAKAARRDNITLDEASNCWLGFIDGVETAKLHNLEALRKQYHLGLLSNTNPFVMDYMDSPMMSADGRPISDYFDSLFLSYRMGVCKPSPEIYLQALEAGNMKPDETVFIDDSPANIEAANKLGIHGIHISTNEDWMPRLQELLQRG